MKRRTAIGGLLGGVGLLVWANRVLAGLVGDLEPGIEGTQRTYRWRGLNVAYTEVGDPDDPDLLALHGINAAGSSREFAPAVARLAAEYHVIAPDLPGFGRSNRSPLRYSASLYTTFVTEFAAEHTENPTCVASSLSGAYATLAAEEVAFDEFVLVCPTGETMPERRAWFRSLVRSPVIGEALFNLLVSKPAIRRFEMDHALSNRAVLTPEFVAYRWETTHQPGARFAPASFVSGFLDPDTDLESTLAGLDIPITLLWGREADLPGVERGCELADTADARLVVFEDAKLLPHVEHPEAFADAVAGRVSEHGE